MKIAKSITDLIGKTPMLEISNFKSKITFLEILL